MYPRRAFDKNDFKKNTINLLPKNKNLNIIRKGKFVLIMVLKGGLKQGISKALFRNLCPE